MFEHHHGESQNARDILNIIKKSLKAQVMFGRHEEEARNSIDVLNIIKARRSECKWRFGASRVDGTSANGDIVKATKILHMGHTKSATKKTIVNRLFTKG